MQSECTKRASSVTIYENRKEEAMYFYKPLTNQEIRLFFPKLLQLQQELNERGMHVRFRVRNVEIERVFGKTKKDAERSTSPIEKLCV